jgi:hypothetical protein
MPIILGLVVALALGGGVSLAANQALPGDALYGVKVHVNEGLQSALAFSDEARANVDISDIDARLAEAEQLQAEGRLNADTLAILEANFDEHAQRVAQRIADFQAKQNFSAAADLAAKFQTSLDAHAATLARLSATANSSTENALSGISGRVRALMSVMAGIRAQAAANASAHANSQAGGSAQGTTASENAAANGTGNATVNAGVNASSSGNGASGAGGVQVHVGI